MSELKHPAQDLPPMPQAECGQGAEAAALRSESLLERSRAQWLRGDFDGLVKLGEDGLQNEPERDKLALLAAAGHLRKGDAAAARQFVRRAQDWGCEQKLVGQVLVAGLHGTLARAAAASGQEARASKHSEAFSEFRDRSFAALAPCPPGTHRVPRLRNPMVVEQAVCHALGDAWAANTVNTVIFRHHGIFARDNFQFTAFYVGEKTLRVVRRDLANDAFDTFDLPGNYMLRDAHNSISLGCDRAGHIHMSYDHHSSKLRYRRSSRPLDIQAWDEEASMTGVHEEKVTYPCFILPDGGRPLLLLYRDGIWNKGTGRIKVYEEAGQCWTDRPAPILSGAEQRPWTSNAYWNHPAVGADGSLHLSFVWRTDSLGAEQRINNINVCYARSDDHGLTWHTSRGRPYKLPITQVNAETVCPVSPGCNLINQTGMALDSRGRPHIVFYSDDPDGVPQYQHLRFDGKVWRHQFISRRSGKFDLAGAGTLQIPISRPDIVIDRQDNAYVVYRGDLTGNRMTVLRLAAPDYRFDPAQAVTAWDEDLGYAEPIIDRTRWQQSNILTLLLQHNRQPDGDLSHDLLNTPVTLLDLKFY